MNFLPVLREILKHNNTGPTSFIDAPNTPTLQGTLRESPRTVDLNLFPTRSDTSSSTDGKLSQSSADDEERVPLNVQGETTSSSDGHISTSVDTGACQGSLYEPPWQRQPRRPASHPQNLPIEVRIPEPGSIRHAIISNPRKRLYVQPDQWTSEHLKLLDVTIKVQPKEKYLSQTPISLQAFKRENNIQTFDKLKNCVCSVHSRYLEKHYKDERMSDIYHLLVRWIIKDKDCKYSLNQARSADQTLDLMYGGSTKPARLICRSVIYTKKQLVRMAYVDKAWLEQDESVNLRGRRRANKKIKHKTNREIHPLLGAETSDMPIDPYYVGLIIAMAQHYAARCRALDLKAQARNFYLCTPSEDRKSFVIYKAYVHTDFVKKFEDPYIRVDRGLVIKREEYKIGMKTAFIPALVNILDLPLNKIAAWDSIEDEPGSSSPGDNSASYMCQDFDNDFIDSDQNSSDADIEPSASTNVSSSKARNVDEALQMYQSTSKVAMKRKTTYQEQTPSMSKKLKAAAVTLPVPAIQLNSPKGSPRSAPPTVSVVGGEHATACNHSAKLVDGTKEETSRPSSSMQAASSIYKNPAGLPESSAPMSTPPENSPTSGPPTGSVFGKEHNEAVENLRLLLKGIKEGKVKLNATPSDGALRIFKTPSASPKVSPPPRSPQPKDPFSLLRSLVEKSERRNEATTSDSPSQAIGGGAVLHPPFSPPPSPVYSPINTPPSSPLNTLSPGNKRKACDTVPDDFDLHKRVKREDAERETAQETTTASSEALIENSSNTTTSENIARIFNLLNSQPPSKLGTSSSGNVQHGEQPQNVINTSTSENFESVNSSEPQAVDELGSTILEMLESENQTPVFGHAAPTTSQPAADSVLPGIYTPTAPQPASDLLASLITPQTHVQSPALDVYDPVAPQTHYPTPDTYDPVTPQLANTTPTPPSGPPTPTTPLQHHTPSLSENQTSTFNHSSPPATDSVAASVIPQQLPSDLLASLITTPSAAPPPQHDPSNPSETNKKRKKDDDDNDIPPSPKRSKSSAGTYFVGLW
ncbi:hypothetical protein HYFRA_00008324 [Hymenoscyphus fraxineus]|uniref:Uncharacterized protein n=1 Tax=Hymenoscyphus fraxineus TaxID=746836 RepID=A0A9N9PNK6_9HELO|nr:hypothetical protein HYFRA_00008324 [Hymenoscyphus fraxineus]